MPIRHQSGRSDISSDRGHTSPGSYPSTMEAPPSNQDGLHRIQVIQRTQEVFGRTLRQELDVLCQQAKSRRRALLAQYTLLVAQDGRGLFTWEWEVYRNGAPLPARLRQ